MNRDKTRTIEFREKLGAYVAKTSAYRVAKGTGLRQQTVTRFLDGGKMLTETWDKIEKYIDENPVD